MDKMWEFESLLFLLPIILYTSKVESVLPESGLCNFNKTVPRESLSCASQLWGNNLENNCTLWLPDNTLGFSPRSNSLECNAVPFQEHPGLKVDSDLIKVKLQAHPFSAEDRVLSIPSLFNITFSQIRKCTSIKMRFSQNGSNQTNFCRDFSISSNEPVADASKLFYDCVWSRPTYEGKAFKFEYYASDKTTNVVGKYLFTFPTTNNIDPRNKKLSESEVFMYMEVTNLPYLKLRLQMQQERFNTTPGDFNVTLHYTNEDGFTTAVKLKSDCVDDDELVFKYDTKSRRGSYHFTAQIDHPDCKEMCLVSRTPSHVDKGDPNERILLIAIVGCGGAVLSVVTFLFFIWRRRKHALQERPPTVLMIYAPTTTKHVTAVVELAKYLNAVCHVEALVDELHIPKSKTKDPFTWCNDAFSRSDFIMVLSSPYHQCNNYEGIYRNVDALGLQLLKQNLGNRNSKQKFFNAVLPYCTDKDLPPEAKNFQRFVLTKDLNKMLSYLHTNSTSVYSQFCVQPFVYGGYSELATSGGALLKAIKGAGLELANKDCVCNQSQRKTPLFDEDFVTIDLNETHAGVQMLPPRERRPVCDEMYPGPIENLNLLGSEGQESLDEARVSSRRSNDHREFDLDNFNLG